MCLRLYGRFVPIGGTTQTARGYSGSQRKGLHKETEKKWLPKPAPYYKSSGKHTGWNRVPEDRSTVSDTGDAPVGQTRSQ